MRSAETVAYLRHCCRCSDAACCRHRRCSKRILVARNQIDLRVGLRLLVMVVVIVSLVIVRSVVGSGEAVKKQLLLL